MSANLAEKAKERLALGILETKALVIRDVAAGEEPFLYSSGNWGPCYVNIKGLINRRSLLESLVTALAIEIYGNWGCEVDFVAGNVTGGMIPGWLLAKNLGQFYGKDLPYVYIRNTRKAGGHKELITGLYDDIRPHSRGLVVEELVNYSQTTCNSAVVLRSSGFECCHAACILFYGHQPARDLLIEHGVEFHYLVDLQFLLNVADIFDIQPSSRIALAREFLVDPLGWQASHNLTPVEKGGTL